MSVTEAVRLARQVLERQVGALWIEGETCSLTRASSGHVYFALKDRGAQLRAVMWRADAQRLRFRLDEGQVLRCRGQLTIYERDGKFQFIVNHAEPAGMGAEALALEQLKRKLAAEGLFERARKRPLPVLPRRIGVVTSRHGAAIRDIIRTVHRRFPVPILLADAAVQGDSAPREIVNAIRAIARTDVDVVIVGRGGGSASDLAAFNHEAVVRAIAECPVPTISAVGHEIDISLADLVADRRAATPTAAGELAVPVLADLADLLLDEERRLRREMDIRVRSARQEIDQLGARASRLMTVRLGEGRQRLHDIRSRLQACHPRAQLVAHRSEVEQLGARLEARMRATLAKARGEFAPLIARLESLSPLRVLERGYAIASRDQHVLTDAAELEPGDAVNVRLLRGDFECRVERVHAPGDADDAPGDAGAAPGDADAAPGDADAGDAGADPGDAS